MLIAASSIVYYGPIEIDYRNKLTEKFNNDIK